MTAEGTWMTPHHANGAETSWGHSSCPEVLYKLCVHFCRSPAPSQLRNSMEDKAIALWLRAGPVCLSCLGRPQPLQHSAQQLLHR